MRSGLHVRYGKSGTARGLSLLAVLLLHAGLAGAILLPRTEGMLPRGAAAEPPTLALIAVAPEQVLPAQPETALTEIPLAVAPPDIAVAAGEAPLPEAQSIKTRGDLAPVPAPVALPIAPSLGAGAGPSEPARPVGAHPKPARAESAQASSHVTRDVYQKVLWQWVAARRPQGIHLEGEAVVSFTLDHRGRLLSSSIERTSGNKLLDRLALRTIRASAPFPAPPIELPGDALTFSLAFNFS